MKNQTISHLLVLLSVSFIFHPVFTQIEPSSQQIPGVTLERTEVRTVHSNIIGSPGIHYKDEITFEYENR